MWTFIWDPERSELTNIKISQALNVLQCERQVWAKGPDQEKYTDFRSSKTLGGSCRRLIYTVLRCSGTCRCSPTDEYSYHHMSKNFLLQQIKVCLDLFYFWVKMKSHFSPVFPPSISHNSQPITFLQIYGFFLHELLFSTHT